MPHVKEKSLLDLYFGLKFLLMYLHSLTVSSSLMKLISPMQKLLMRNIFRSFENCTKFVRIKTNIMLFRLITLTVLFILPLIASSQDDLFPMKGDYIYYDFEEQTHNTKHCIKYYSSVYDSLGQSNSSASEFVIAVMKKCMNLNELKVTFRGLKNTDIKFMINPSLTKDCIGELNSPNGFTLKLPTGTQILENNILFSLLTIGKFKVYGQLISATVKVVFKSDTKYSLVFTNFQITYYGTQGTKAVNETLNLEEVCKNLKNSRMYDKGKKSIQEIDKLVKACAKVYSQELKRIYEIDEL